MVLTSANFKYNVEPILNNTFDGIYDELEQEYTQGFASKVGIQIKKYTLYLGAILLTGTLSYFLPSHSSFVSWIGNVTIATVFWVAYFYLWNRVVYKI